VEIAYTWHGSATKTIEDAQSLETIFAAGGGPATVIYPTLLNKIVGTRFRLIRGYVGAQNANLAMQRGEVDGATSSYNTVSTTTDWLTTGKVNVLVQYSPDRHPNLSNVRTIGELVTTSEDKALFAFLTQASAVGRSIVAPPDVPQEIIEILRGAFDATMKDPQFLAELRQAKAEYDPLRGRELQRLVAQKTELSTANKERVQAARSE
jgi:tripartite-type tricarboxylate transporter receptor subunit TctC